MDIIIIVITTHFSLGIPLVIGLIIFFAVVLGLLGSLVPAALSLPYVLASSVRLSAAGILFPALLFLGAAVCNRIVRDKKEFVVRSLLLSALILGVLVVAAGCAVSLTGLRTDARFFTFGEDGAHDLWTIPFVILLFALMLLPLCRTAYAVASLPFALVSKEAFNLKFLCSLALWLGSMLLVFAATRQVSLWFGSNAVLDSGFDRLLYMEGLIPGLSDIGIIDETRALDAVARVKSFLYGLSIPAELIAGAVLCAAGGVGIARLER